MIARCVRLVKTMLGEPGDALRVRELKTRGQIVEFPTKETEETQDPRGSGLYLSGKTTLRANVWRFATRQNEALRQEQIDREGPEKDAQACPKVLPPGGRDKKFGAVPSASSRLGTRKT